MNYLASNLCYMIWRMKQRQNNIEYSYSEYIDVLAGKCRITPSRFRAILQGSAEANAEEITSLKQFFADFARV